MNPLFKKDILSDKINERLTAIIESSPWHLWDQDFPLGIYPAPYLLSVQETIALIASYFALKWSGIYHL